MRIYIAAPWKDRDKAANMALRLEHEGYSITHPWWLHEGESKDLDYMRECAKEDIIGVKLADVMVLINTRKSEGKAVEQGIALAFEIPIIGCGKLAKHNVFQYLPAYQWAADGDALLEVLRGEAHKRGL